MEKKSILHKLIAFVVIAIVASAIAPSNEAAVALVILGVVIIPFTPIWLGVIATTIPLVVFYLFPALGSNGFWGGIATGLIALVIDKLIENNQKNADKIAHAREMADERKRQQEEKENEKVQAKRKHIKDLIREMGSRDNGIALNAVAQLDDLGALRDGTLNEKRFNAAGLHYAELQGAMLIKSEFVLADLCQAQLNDAHLERADLTLAHLSGTWLDGTNLRGAILHYTKLDGAHLPGTHLENAFLSGAILTGAKLRGVHLEGANLKGANLKGADFSKPADYHEDPSFNEETILPDGSHWKPGADMTRFTNP